MSTRVLSVTGPPQNTIAVVQHNGQTMRVRVSEELRPQLQQSVGGVLPPTLAEQLLAGRELGPRAVTYDNNPGSAYNPSTGAFPSTAAGVAAAATIPGALAPASAPGAGEALLFGDEEPLPDLTAPVQQPLAVSSSGTAAPPATAPAPQDWMRGPFVSAIRNSGQEQNLPQIRAAIEEAAERLGVHPSAVAAIISMESGFNPNAQSPSGTYRGATQLGPATFREAGGRLGGVTFEEYQRLPLADQIRIYPEYLQHYGRANLIRELAADQSPSMQAALLQGFQFAPNDPTRPANRSFVAGFREGDYSRPTTSSPQASRLGDRSLGQMEAYFASLLSDDVEVPQRAGSNPVQERFNASGGLSGEAGAPPASARDPAGTEEAAGPRTLGERIMAGLDDLPEALQYLELPDNAQRMRVPDSPGIYRPRRSDTGTQALKRFGLASLA